MEAHAYTHCTHLLCFAFTPRVLGRPGCLHMLEFFCMWEVVFNIGRKVCYIYFCVIKRNFVVDNNYK